MSGFADGTSREDIRNLLQDYGPIAWVDFSKGDKEVSSVGLVVFTPQSSISRIIKGPRVSPLPLYI